VEPGVVESLVGRRDESLVELVADEVDSVVVGLDQRVSGIGPWSLPQHHGLILNVDHGNVRRSLLPSRPHGDDSVVLALVGKRQPS